MLEKKIPWWRRALNFALGGIRSGFGLFSHAEKLEPATEPISSKSFQDHPEEEAALPEPFPKSEVVTVAATVPAETVAEPTPAIEPEPRSTPAINQTAPVDSIQTEAEVTPLTVAEPQPSAEAVTELEPVAEPVATDEATVTPEPAPAPEVEEPTAVAEAPVAKTEPAPKVAPTVVAESSSKPPKTDKQAAERLNPERGRGFNRRMRRAESRRSLASANQLPPVSPQVPDLSAVRQPLVETEPLPETIALAAVQATIADGPPAETFPEVISVPEPTPEPIPELEPVQAAIPETVADPVLEIEPERAEEPAPEPLEEIEAVVAAEPIAEPVPSPVAIQTAAVNESPNTPVPEPTIAPDPEPDAQNVSEENPISIAVSEPVTEPEVEATNETLPEPSAETPVEVAAEAEPLTEPTPSTSEEVQVADLAVTEHVAEPELAEAPDAEALKEPGVKPESEATIEIVEESASEELEAAEPVTESEPSPIAEPIPASAIEQALPTSDLPSPALPEPPPANEPEPTSELAPAADTAATLVLTTQPTAEEIASGKAEERTAAKLAARQKKLDESSEQSPFSVMVGQVYDGPLDLLLDLIRKQDIDIYDIPIAKITAQFLSYVNQLKAGDMDVAGEFIYTASMLIHIKSRMLLPRAASGPDDAAEDPRRELVERLLEHERFKNAAQMLQQKQMLESATWTNPGVREFKDDTASEPDIAADTDDLVRIFRDILERARKRPAFNVQEDSVTVGQMIQFLARRLTMEDKPVALRRLLSHTRSERALIAMFLALLELVRLQAILLRQDRAFSEIFIKKHTAFDTVMNEGLANAHDDWR